jgi:hypothetical protein
VTKMTDDAPKICIYPGCERHAVPPHPMGGPQPAFCDREDHNALSTHLERKRIAALDGGGASDDTAVAAADPKEQD